MRNKILVLMISLLAIAAMQLHNGYLIAYVPSGEYENQSLSEYLSNLSHALSDQESLHPLLSAIDEQTLVLLGESTHGTSEYYLWRGEISKRLIEEKGYNFIVVEGDWPSFYQINLYVKGLAHQERTAEELLREHFNRWPPWMWANDETAGLVEWLKSYNEERPEGDKVGIYGMDVYSKEESINEVREYLRAQEEERFASIAALYDCFTPYSYDGGNYARAIFRGVADCSEQVRDVVEFLRSNSDELSEECLVSYFNAKQNAIIVKNAEKHYRSAIGRGPESWNYRVLHMEQTVYRLLEHYGSDAKGVVWAHNTHIGDARATPMYDQGSYNIGQLARVNLGRDKVFSVGFGCFKGRVLAGSSWGSAMQTMNIPNAMRTSIEYKLWQVPKRDFLLVFDSGDIHPELTQPIGHRAIGVVYNPRQEAGNYVPTILPERYDAFIFFEETVPLSPLH